MPGGLQDIEIDSKIIEKINWENVYRLFYIYKINNHIDEFKGSLENILDLIGMHI